MLLGTEKQKSPPVPKQSDKFTEMPVLLGTEKQKSPPVPKQSDKFAQIPVFLGTGRKKISPVPKTVKRNNCFESISYLYLLYSSDMTTDDIPYVISVSRSSPTLSSSPPAIIPSNIPSFEKIPPPDIPALA